MQDNSRVDCVDLAPLSGSLFEPDSEPHNDSLVNFDPSLTHDLISLGYFNAAYQLSTSEAFAKDVDVFPVLFLFRHALELQLKVIIWRHRNRGPRNAGWPGKKHGLEDLVREVKRICPVYSVDSGAADLVYAWWVVGQFARLDPNSTNLRYRDQSQGESPLDGLDRISVPRIAEAARCAWFALGSIDEQIQLSLDRSYW